jgi:hypothetical protein
MGKMNGWDVSHHQKGSKMGRMKGLSGALLLLLMFLATAWALDCQSLGLRVAEVSLDAPIKDVVWLEGKVRSKPGAHRTQGRAQGNVFFLMIHALFGKD